MTTYPGTQLPINVHVFERNLSAPTPGRFVEDIGPLLSTYEHSIARNGGFESLTLTLTVDLASALRWLERLAYPVICYDRSADIIWEGLISSVSFAVEAERLDLTIDDLANLVRVRYQSTAGATVFTGFIFNTDSIAIYGEKELTVSAGKLPAGAAPLVQQTTLREREWPVAQRTGGALAALSQDQSIELTIGARGWASTLRWIESNTATVNETLPSHTQIRDQLIAYNTDNPFFSTDYSGIEPIGPTQTVVYEDQQTQWDRITVLNSLGDSSGEPTAWGVGIGRKAYFRRWAGFTPNVVTYRRALGSSVFLNQYGSPVDAWRLQPDSLYQITDLVDPGVQLTAVTVPSTYYVERVVCRIDQQGITARMEPSRTNAVDVLIARSRN